MGVITYIAAIVLAAECLGSGLASSSLDGLDAQARGLSNQVQNKAIDASSIRLISRNAQPTHHLGNLGRGSNASKNPVVSLSRSNSAPPRTIQSGSMTSKDSLHRLHSAPEGLPLHLNTSPKGSRQATPTKARNEASQSSMASPVRRIQRGAEQTEPRTSTSKPPISVQLTKPARSKGHSKVRTKSASTDGGALTSSDPSSSKSRLSNIRTEPRIAQDSGARPSDQTVGKQPSTSATIGMSAQDQTRLIEHRQWLTETKEAVQTAESNLAKMSKARRRLQQNQTPRMAEAAALAHKSKTSSKEARTIAKDTLSKADEVLKSEPASSSKASTCLSIIDHKARTACAMGAVHAKTERKAAMVASEDRRWDFAAKHIKVSATAMTRARAFEAQNNAFMAQHAAKANDEKVKSLSPDHPERKKAEQNAQSSHTNYQKKVLFYKSVHSQYRQTRHEFKGSDSEDEERTFPDTS